MIYRVLGRTGLSVSRLAFGAGPVSGLMTGDDSELQRATLEAAIRHGINWIDTAAGYGQGASETNVGRVLNELGCLNTVHVATKVRIAPEQLGNIRAAIRQSVQGSLARLNGLPITLLQLHNGLTVERNAEPFSITAMDVLGPDGVLETLKQLRDEGIIRFLGLTGTGNPAVMREVVLSGGFDTVQVPYNLLNPSAGQPVATDEVETDYGQIIAASAEQRMGVFAIRVFAGGALVGQEPSAHTHKTPFFPLAQYLRDRDRATSLADSPDLLKDAALRFVLDDTRVHSAIIGIANPVQVEELARLLGVEA